jgi:hypothetical protein
VDIGPEAVSKDPLPLVGSTEPVRVAYLALDIVSPGAAPAAAALYRATVPVGLLAGRWSWPGQENEYGQKWSKEWAEAIDEWDDARHAFVDAVRADLGVNLGALGVLLHYLPLAQAATSPGRRPGFVAMLGSRILQSTGPPREGLDFLRWTRPDWSHLRCDRHDLLIVCPAS